jgi:hypothetical protein
VEKLLSSYRDCRTKNKKLNEKISRLEKQLYTEKSDKAILKEKNQAQRLKTSEFTGDIERKLKLIREKASLISGEENE